MQLRVSALVFVAGTFILPAAAQQNTGNPWDVIGGYVCFQTVESSTSEKLYLLPDMTWSRNAPFTSFALRQHLNSSYSFRQPENLPDWMQVMVYITQRNHRYKTFVDSGWKPRLFRYEEGKLSLYTVEKPSILACVSHNPCQLLEDLQMKSLFREFQVDPVKREMRQIRAGTDPKTLLVCRGASLF